MDEQLSQLVARWLNLDKVSSIGPARELCSCLVSHQNDVSRKEIQQLWDSGNVKELESRMRYISHLSNPIYPLTTL